MSDAGEIVLPAIYKKQSIRTGIVNPSSPAEMKRSGISVRVKRLVMRLLVQGAERDYLVCGARDHEWPED